MYPLHQSKASPRVSPSVCSRVRDIDVRPKPTRSLLVDGYIAYTLQPPAAASTYLLRLLSSTTADRLQPIFNQRAILIRRTCLRYNSRETDDTQEIVLLDYLVDPTTGTVVPQKLPSLVGAGAGEHQRLHVPFFFSQSNSGTLGLALSAAFSPDESSSSSSIRRDGAVLLDNAILVLNVRLMRNFKSSVSLTVVRSGRGTPSTLVHKQIGTQEAVAPT